MLDKIIRLKKFIIILLGINLSVTLLQEYLTKAFSKYTYFSIAIIILQILILVATYYWFIILSIKKLKYDFPLRETKKVVLDYLMLITIIIGCIFIYFKIIPKFNLNISNSIFLTISGYLLLLFYTIFSWLISVVIQNFLTVEGFFSNKIIKDIFVFVKVKKLPLIVIYCCKLIIMFFIYIVIGGYFKNNNIFHYISLIIFSVIDTLNQIFIFTLFISTVNEKKNLTTAST